MTLQEMPYHELERHHEQAKQAMKAAIRQNREEIYRNAEELEIEVRYEKIRRQQEREEPDTERVVL